MSSGSLASWLSVGFSQWKRLARLCPHPIPPPRFQGSHCIPGQRGIALSGSSVLSPPPSLLLPPLFPYSIKQRLTSWGLRVLTMSTVIGIRVLPLCCKRSIFNFSQITQLDMPSLSSGTLTNRPTLASTTFSRVTCRISVSVASDFSGNNTEKEMGSKS